MAPDPLLYLFDIAANVPQADLAHSRAIALALR
jgi:hypothetical protein